MKPLLKSLRALVKSLGGSLFISFVLASAASAQTVPFGKNKIQYTDFDWRVLAGQHVDVYYYPEEEQVAHLALSYAEESYAVLERKFQHHPFRRIPLIVYSSDQHFEQTNVFPGFIPEGVLGFTEYLKRRVALPFRGDYDQFRKTLRHELIHAFQLSKISQTAAMHPRARRPPPQQIHWWTEGLAEYWSSEQTAEDEMFVRDLVLSGDLPDIAYFSATYSFLSYPLGAELHKYLGQRFGEEYIVRLYEDYWKYDSFTQALAGVLGVELKQLSREWKYALEQRYFAGYESRPPLGVGSRELISRGYANFKPVVHTVAGDTAARLLFLSPRSGYTTLYQTTLAGGEETLDKVVVGERSAEFESFHAYESGFDVNRNDVVAVVARYLERDALVLWSLGEKKIVGRYQWPDLVGLKSPAWDPTGTRVVFEGLSAAGFSDLYTIDFTSQARSALTHDKYGDHDPDWAPDGRTIVFSSDRNRDGGAGFTNLYALEVGTGVVRPITAGAWHDQQPRWSRSGDRIAFSSDRAGTYDLYTIDLSGRGRRVTALTGGAFDPEWLPNDQGLVFAGFSDGQFRIYSLAVPRPDSSAVIAAVDPPDAGASAAQWEWETASGSIGKTQQVSPYKPLQKVSVDFASGAAAVAPGFGAAEGAQFLVSDLLGNHILFAGISAVQANNVGDLIDNFSGNLFYLNLAHRLNYGVGLYRFEGQFRDVAFDIYEERTAGGYFLASYPFSRFKRVEAQLALESSHREDLEDIGAILFGGSTEPDVPDLTRSGKLASNYLSYVKDNTLWVSTGPIDGERYNITAGLVSCFECTYTSPLIGAPYHRPAAVDNYILTGDYRRYFRTSQYSAYAIRAYGFLSSGTIPSRAVLGGPHRLRGYPRFSLAGSRVWLLNQEWRFPILNGLGLSFPFGDLRLPGIQGAFFGDIGSSSLDQQDRRRGAWGSYGMGFRSSFGAPLVLRMDVGRRFRIGSMPPVVFSNGERFGDTFVDFFFGFNY